MTQPSKTDAMNICDALMQRMFQLRQELEERAPEGRSLTLGVTMFIGIFMSGIAEEDWRTMCDAAAQGYARTTLAGLNWAERRAKGRMAD
jgi:hypothetical protein